MKTNPDIDHLQDRIKEMRIEYERYFSGALDIPPGELRDRVAAEVRSLRDRGGLRSVDRFRVSQLEARFNSYNELFNRRMREHEEGRSSRRKNVDAEPRFNPRHGIVVSGEKLDPAVAEALYSGLAGGGSTPRFDLETFKTYLDRQHRSIREKTGCSEIRFRLAEQNGKTTLKVKPLSPAEPVPTSD